ncbi:PH and SEC7 domain-containing protein-like [Hyperolius riggenbachi]|uniref:PH and SEC7 domain-containing protein-like n=1 Tax=Hyperolius riggenbachi TaxID=752182 RepID=UPI0035A3545D
MLDYSQPGPADQEVGDTPTPDVAETNDPDDEEQTEDIPVQQPHRITPTQRRVRTEDNTPPSRHRPGPVPTRRETEAEMSRAVSGLLGILRSQETILTRQLTDGDRGHLMEQYRAHIESLQRELETVHKHYQDELKLLHEQYHSQFEQLRLEHYQQVFQMQQQMQQMQQQMQQQNCELMRQQTHPGYHTVMSLIPFFGQSTSYQHASVPLQLARGCQTAHGTTVQSTAWVQSNTNYPLDIIVPKLPGLQRRYIHTVNKRVKHFQCEYP